MPVDAAAATGEQLGPLASVPRSHDPTRPRSLIERIVDTIEAGFFRFTEPSSTERTMAYKTSCHCGAVSIVMHRRIRKLTSCNCSICRRYGALWAYQQRKAIEIDAVSGALQTYARQNGDLVFFRCAHCGCVTHYERQDRRDNGTDMSAVNMRNVDNPAQISDIPIRYLDGASTWKVLHEDVQPYLFRSSSPK